MSLTKQSLGILIRNYRDLKGLKQTELADKLGIHYQQLQSYESGNHFPSVEMLYKIINVLDMPCELIFKDAKIKDFLDKVDERFLKYNKIIAELDKNEDLVNLHMFYLKNKDKLKKVNVTKILKEIAK